MSPTFVDNDGQLHNFSFLLVIKYSGYRLSIIHRFSENASLLAANSKFMLRLSPFYSGSGAAFKSPPHQTKTPHFETFLLDLADI